MVSLKCAFFQGMFVESFVTVLFYQLFIIISIHLRFFTLISDRFLCFVCPQTKVEEIQRTLAVNVSTLSATIRRLTSAEDKRPSATGIGYVGISIIAFLCGAIILMDSTILFRDLKILYNNLKQTCCASKKNVDSDI